MANNLTDVGETRTLDWLTGNATTALTAPLMVRLMTVNGTDAAPGTEVVGGSYAAQSVAFGAATSPGGTTSNSGVVSFTGMPVSTVVGLEIWDSAGSPIRWWFGPLTTPRTLALNDALTFPIGSIVLTLS